MKKLVFIVTLCVISLAGSAQNDDLITVPSKVIVDAANKILELERVDSIKTLQLTNLKQQVFSLETIITNTKSIVELKDKEIEIYKGAIKNIVPSPEQPKQKWYETPVASYIAGVLTGGVLIYVGATIAY